MNPADIASVRRSWAELEPRRIPLARELAASLGGPVTSASPRAARLVDAVGELVDLLAVPSLLEQHAHRLVTEWQGAPPCAGVEGEAWVAAARLIAPSWSDGDELAWHHAWLVLCDVLAGCARSPFAGAAYVPGAHRST